MIPTLDSDRYLTDQPEPRPPYYHSCQWCGRDYESLELDPDELTCPECQAGIKDGSLAICSYNAHTVFETDGFSHCPECRRYSSVEIVPFGECWRVVAQVNGEEETYRSFAVTRPQAEGMATHCRQLAAGEVTR